jgi:hypothetical protein
MTPRDHVRSGDFTSVFDAATRTGHDSDLFLPPVPGRASQESCIIQCPCGRHESTLDDLAAAGLTKTYDQFKEKAPDLASTLIFSLSD